MATCSKCGTPIPDGAQFCTSCGAPVTAAATQQQGISQDTAPMPPVRNYQTPTPPPQGQQIPQQPPQGQFPAQSPPGYAPQQGFGQTSPPKKNSSKAIIMAALILLGGYYFYSNSKTEQPASQPVTQQPAAQPSTGQPGSQPVTQQPTDGQPGTQQPGSVGNRQAVLSYLNNLEPQIQQLYQAAQSGGGQQVAYQAGNLAQQIEQDGSGIQSSDPYGYNLLALDYQRLTCIFSIAMGQNVQQAIQMESQLRQQLQQAIQAYQQGAR